MMDAVLLGILVVGGGMALGLVGMAVVRRRVAHQLLTPHNAVGSYLYARAGVLYALMLSLVVVTVWNEYEIARTQTEREANTIGDLVRLAGSFPDAQREAARTALFAYAQSVIDDEWPTMARHQSADPRTEAHYEAIWAVYQQLGQEPAVMGTAPYFVSLDQLAMLSDARRLRLLEAKRELPPLLWVVLIVGNGLTLGYAWFFGVESDRAHAAMIASLAVAISLVLYLAYMLNYPYRGDVGIQPDAFREVVRLLEPT